MGCIFGSYGWFVVQPRPAASTNADEETLSFGERRWNRSHSEGPGAFCVIYLMVSASVSIPVKIGIIKIAP